MPRTWSSVRLDFSEAVDHWTVEQFWQDPLTYATSDSRIGLSSNPNRDFWVKVYRPFTKFVAANSNSKLIALIEGIISAPLQICNTRRPWMQGAQMQCLKYFAFGLCSLHIT